MNEIIKRCLDSLILLGYEFEILRTLSNVQTALLSLCAQRRFSKIYHADSYLAFSREHFQELHKLTDMGLLQRLGHGLSSFRTLKGRDEMSSESETTKGLRRQLKALGYEDSIFDKFSITQICCLINCGVYESARPDGLFFYSGRFDTHISELASYGLIEVFKNDKSHFLDKDGYLIRATDKRTLGKANASFKIKEVERQAKETAPAFTMDFGDEGGEPEFTMDFGDDEAQDDADFFMDFEEEENLEQELTVEYD